MGETDNRQWAKTILLAIAAGAAAAGTYYAVSKALQYYSSTGTGKKPKEVDVLLNDIKQQLETPVNVLESISEAMQVEMSAGLRTSGGSRLKMLPSFVERLPSGDEKGLYYALDLGGTNFRVLRVMLGGKEKRVVRQEYDEVSIPPELMTGSTEDLFDFIAKKLSEFVGKESQDYKPLEGQIREIGFTFSFPVEQTAINGGSLIRWTKGFKVAGTVGQDIVKVLEEAMARQKLDMRVAALVNDTVGTLAGARYWDDDTMVALILGTGTNACYVERMDAIGKWTGPQPECGEMVINMEWGNFFSSTLPITFADKELDEESMNPGEQNFEKLISGMYLGDIARRLLLKLAKEANLFGPTVPPLLEQKGSFPTPKMSKLDMDTTENLQTVKDIVENVLEISDTTLEQRKIVHAVCEAVARRGARLAAAGILGVLKKIGRDCADAKKISGDSSLHGLQKYKTSVAVDGGLYEHYPKFRNEMHETVGALMGPEATGLITIEISKDGSGIGAALLAASHSGFNGMPGK